MTNIPQDTLMSYVVAIISVIILVSIELARSSVTKTHVTDKLLKGAFACLRTAKKPIQIEVSVEVMSRIREQLREGSLDALTGRMISDLFQQIAEANSHEKGISSFMSNLVSTVFVISDDKADIDLILKNAQQVEKLLSIFCRVTPNE